MTAPAELAVDTLVVGAGISGLGFCAFSLELAAARGAAPPRLAIVEAADEPGGYCRTVERSGFVWDYSGHFFHFRHPELLAFLVARMPGQRIATIERRAKIRFAGRDIDFPFQAHLHQLPERDLRTCLADLYDAERAPPRPPATTFKQHLLDRYGAGLCESFFFPYNEKLYACDLDELDAGAMGRFFPAVDLATVMAALRPSPPGAPPPRYGYNATFSYPAGGAVQFVRALASGLPADALHLGERLVSIDRAARVATTSRRRIAYRRLVSSAPLPALLSACGEQPPPGLLRANAVAVFNLGFDRKGRRDVHWMYFPDRARSFYRVGWYDNLLGGDRQSLYVELGMPKGSAIDVEVTLRRVLEDLRAEGIIIDHRLVDWHHVVLDPAYVHLSRASIDAAARHRAALGADDIYSIGRYGAWTYCSIEDNLVEARALAEALVT